MSEQLPSRWLVTTDWLSQHLDDPNVVVVDGSFYLPALKRNAKEEYLKDGRGGDILWTCPHFDERPRGEASED